MTKFINGKNVISKHALRHDWFHSPQGYGRIIFARTALEIKSSVGAKPVDMFGMMHHSNPL
jgi:hypothetical protein